MLPLIPFLVLVAGIVGFAFADKEKPKEVFRAMVWMALLVVLASLATWHAYPLSPSWR